MLLQLKKITKKRGERTILDDISLDLETGDRLGIIGNNGAGKSTLAAIILGNVSPDEGVVIWHRKACTIGFLSQFLVAESDVYDNRVEKPFEQLSGGEKTRALLTRILGRSPDVLVLDEPTNHLDFTGVQWLINQLIMYRGTLIVISHNRYFLDAVTEKTLQIEQGKGTVYKGNYSFFKQENNHRVQAQMKAYNLQISEQKRIAKELSQLAKWSEKGHRTSTKKEGFKEFYRSRAKKKDRQIKSKQHRLEKMMVAQVEKPKGAQKITFEFKDELKSGRVILEAIEIGKAYEKTVFSKGTFTVMRGEKVALFGANGTGKSTFIKIISGEVPLDTGKCYISPSLKVGIMSQETLPEGNKKVVDTLAPFVSLSTGYAQTVLASMGFTQAMMQGKVSQLSLGEATRLKIALLMVQECHVLVMDEPTNHLDIESSEVIESALIAYSGTLLIASHDIMLLQNVCDSVLLFKNKTIEKKAMTFTAYWRDNKA